MSWLADRTGIHVKLDSHSLPNLVKNLSPVAGGLIGGPLGFAVAGGLSALGDKGRGKDVSLGNALTNAGLASSFGALKGALSHGASAGLPAPGFTPAAAPDAASIAPGVPNLVTSNALPSESQLFSALGQPAAAEAPTSVLNTVSSAAGDVAKQTDPHSILHSITGGLGRVGKFAVDHPNATASALNAAGTLATSGAQNRAANAQASLLEKQAEESEYDFLRRKQRDEQMAPLWSALGTSFGNNYAKVAPNPYRPSGA